MRITSVSYKKIFPGDQPFTNETIGVEMQVDEGDNLDLAFKMAKSHVHEWHKPSFPVNPPALENYKIDSTTQIGVIPTIDRKQIEKMEISIDNAKTKEELNKLKPTLPISLTEHFEKRLNELS